MRTQTSLVSIFAAVATAALVLAGWSGGFAAPNLASRLADNRPNAVAVDTELVLAVDVSYSMDPEEQALQREGYIAGITSREFMDALRGGMHGKVAMTYFEWAGPGDQRIVVPWRLIDGPETAALRFQTVSKRKLRSCLIKKTVLWPRLSDVALARSPAAFLAARPDRTPAISTTKSWSPDRRFTFRCRWPAHCSRWATATRCKATAR